MKTKNKKFTVLLICSAIFYGAMFLLFKVGVYNDSQQYIDMHIHREPGYSFFLWLIRQVVGDLDRSLWIAAVLQNILTIYVTAKVVDFFSEEFKLNKIETTLLMLLQFVPHLVTVFMSVTRVVFSNGILSESLCYPLFQLFIVFCYKAFFDTKNKSVIWCAVIGFLLAITRSQFMITFLIWLVLLAIKCLMKKKYRAILIVVLLTGVMFVSRSYLFKCYNYVFNEKHFVAGTYSGVNTLANVMYASDREDGERIEDEFTREMFYLMYDEMCALGWSRENAGEGFLEQGIFLEDTHDRIKFDVLDRCYADVLENLGYTDYYDREMKADATSMEMIKALLPSCFGVWLGNYFVLAFRGMMRCIGITHPFIGIVVWGLYAFAFAMCIYKLYKDKWSREGWLLFIALLSVLALSFSTAITIMCLSRYMIYGFVPFYTALLMVVRETEIYKRGLQR